MKQLTEKIIECGGKRYELSVRMTDEERVYLVVGERKKKGGGMVGFGPPVVFEDNIKEFAAGMLEMVKLMLNKDRIEELKHNPKLVVKKRPVRSGLGESVMETVGMYVLGKKVEEIVAERGLMRETIVDHLIQWYIGGGMLRVGELVTETEECQIREAVEKVGMEKLRLIKDIVGDEVGYEQIKLVVAKIRKQVWPGKNG